MNIYTSKTQKGMLLIMAMLAMVGAVYATFPDDYPVGIGPSLGDYMYTPPTSLSYGKFTDTSGWEVYNGTDWVAPSETLSQKQPSFGGKIYLNGTVIMDTNFQLDGHIIGNPENNLDERLTVDGPYTFTLNTGGNVSVHNILVEDNSKFINKGSTTVTDLQLEYGSTNQAGGKLDNSGTINVGRKLWFRKEAEIVSREGGTIMGNGTLETPTGSLTDVRIKIANAGGYDAAIQLAANPNNVPISYYFIGTTDQVSGNNMPLPVYSVSVESGHKLTLSKPITLNGLDVTSRAEPDFSVASGSSLDLQGHTISSLSSNGASTFKLEDGATVITAHADGISSIRNSGLITDGAIRLNFAEYSSGANYVFSGTGVTGQRQFSGCFTTSPATNTVRNITNSNTNPAEMLELCPSFRPLHYTEAYHGNFSHDEYDMSEGYVDPQNVPVTLSYFNAFFNGFDSVALQWETQTETNNLGFYILRSTEPEAVNATVVSELIPAANTSQGAVYYFEDSNLYDDGLYYYWLQDVSFAGAIELHGPAMAQVTLNAGGNQSPSIPLKTSFTRSYPNPFNPSTQLEYYLEKGADVEFQVYNLKGQLVDQITLRHQDSGFHRYTWKPQLSSGVYLIRFTAEGKSNTRKVILAK